MEKIILFIARYSVESIYSMQAFLMGIGSNDIDTEILLNGPAVLAMTSQFYNKFPKQDLENEYTKAIIDEWAEGKVQNWIDTLKMVKSNGRLKVYVCQPCIEAFQKKFGKLDILDVVDGKINGIELFNKLKNDKDYLFLTL